MADEKELEKEPLTPPEEPDEDAVIYVEKKRRILFGLPLTFTKYTITPSILTIDQGLFKTTENDCYLYKIQDVKLTRSLPEKLFGLGTVSCYTGDTTTPEIQLLHIKNAKEIKTYLLKQSEAARLKRRTLSTMDISARGMIDADGNGIPDFME